MLSCFFSAVLKDHSHSTTFLNTLQFVEIDSQGRQEQNTLHTVIIMAVDDQATHEAEIAALMVLVGPWETWMPF